MKFIDQMVFEKGKGDCVRACLASILEFPIKDMPNFWEVAYNVEEFWKLVNTWISDNYNYNCLITKNLPTLECKDILCIAIGSPAHCDGKECEEVHAVIWFEGKVIFDPHPNRAGLSKINSFLFLIPTINRFKDPTA